MNNNILETINSNMNALMISVLFVLLLILLVLYKAVRTLQRIENHLTESTQEDDSNGSTR